MREKTILVVDDEPEYIRLLSKFLEVQGYRSLLAENGGQAMTIYESERPDLVLLDYRMPEETGLEVLRNLKAFDPDACVIIVTAVLDKGLYGQFMAEGASDYITKPIDLERLELAIRTRMTLLGIS
jgi:two-component system response regulator AtoC